MNSGIIRDALTTTLILELEYREPSVAREIETESEQPSEHQYPQQLFEDEFCLAPQRDLKGGEFHDERGNSTLRIWHAQKALEALGTLSQRTRMGYRA